MNIDLYALLLIALAFIVANMPFLSQRFFFFFRSGRVQKPLYLRLLELVGGYILIAALAYACEAHIGNVVPATWELYAITACLFLVCAFPGFVWRYLSK